MPKFEYYNDTQRDVSIHSATKLHGCNYEGDSVIKHGEVKTFELPNGTYPWVKMWDYKNYGLQILVSPSKYEERNTTIIDEEELAKEEKYFEELVEGYTNMGTTIDQELEADLAKYIDGIIAERDKYRKALVSILPLPLGYLSAAKNIATEALKDND